MQTGAAAYQYGGDVSIVQRIGYTVEKHAVTRHDIITLFAQPVAFLRVPAATVARRKDNLHAHVIEHSQHGNRNLAEQLFIAAAGEIKPDSLPDLGLAISLFLITGI